jgi:hypothetical protein
VYVTPTAAPCQSTATLSIARCTGGLPPALLSLLAIRDQHQRREALKQQMALAAQHILAEPEKHLTPGVRTLLACSADEDGQVSSQLSNPCDGLSSALN